MDIAVLEGAEADIARHDHCGALYPVNTLRNLALLQVCACVLHIAQFLSVSAMCTLHIEPFKGVPACGPQIGPFVGASARVLDINYTVRKRVLCVTVVLEVVSNVSIP